MRILTLIGFLLTLPAFASAPNLDIPNVSQLEAILEDFNGNMVPSTATGASSATVIGFELGIVASQIESPNLQIEDPNVDKIFNGGLYAKLELPLGFGVEVIHVPVDSDGLEYDYTSIGAYYSSTGIISTKIKAFTIDGNIKFNEPSSTALVEYQNSGYGASLTFGKRFLLIEPYIGVGYVNSESKLTASSSVFSNGVDVIARNGLEEDSTYGFAGLDIDLLFVSVGIEFSNPYGNKKVAGRLAFGF